MLEGEHLDEKTNYQFSSKLDAEQDFGVKISKRLFYEAYDLVYPPEPRKPMNRTVFNHPFRSPVGLTKIIDLQQNPKLVDLSNLLKTKFNIHEDVDDIAELKVNVYKVIKGKSGRCVVSNKYKGKWARNDDILLEKEGKTSYGRLYLLFQFEYEDITHNLVIVQKWRTKQHSNIPYTFGMREYVLTDSFHVLDADLVDKTVQMIPNFKTHNTQKETWIVREPFNESQFVEDMAAEARRILEERRQNQVEQTDPMEDGRHNRQQENVTNEEEDEQNDKEEAEGQQNTQEDEEHNQNDQDMETNTWEQEEEDELDNTSEEEHLNINKRRTRY